MKKLIAIVGMAGSGKSIATDYLEGKGWTKIYFGGVIYDHMRKEGIDITPDSQKEYRENLRKEYGMGAVAILLLEDIEKSYEAGNTVLDGLYSWDEFVILKEKFQDDLKLVCVCCDKNLRYERVGKRTERPFNQEEIFKRDMTEIENLAKGGPIAIADYYLFNNGSLDDYESRLIEILEDIEKHEGEK